ncbi:hypothetical protein [Acidovorax sp. SDU_ACID1]|uniref:hypothetical protein n=1 Tax=Acidovorax sp. SDU_ACID1 TaxID=3136632 RepID=UPI001AD38E55|nr:hypothetical protein [Comamonadaceae bacterium]
MTDREKPTRDFLKEALAADFEVYEKYSGWHKHGGEKVYYDLVLRAKDHLVQQGFDPGYFVIEVKLFNLDDVQKHDVKARDMMWQCVAYSFSDIELPSGELVRPLFVLYYIDGSGVKPEYEKEINALHHFVQRGGVGRLVFERIDPGQWLLNFGGSRYFSKRRGRGSHNVGVKRQTGSSR